jgi:biotin carboxyl carrier protein
MKENDVLTKKVKKVSYKSLLIENIKYRTLLTKKYQSRKPYEKKDIKKITAFIPGTIKKVYVKPGKKVKEGDKLLILEAMKMKNELLSPTQGTVKTVLVKSGDMVSKSQLLIEFE